MHDIALLHASQQASSFWCAKAAVCADNVTQASCMLQGASKVQQPKAPLAKHEGVERKVLPTRLCHAAAGAVHSQQQTGPMPATL